MRCPALQRHGWLAAGLEPGTARAPLASALLVKRVHGAGCGAGPGCAAPVSSSHRAHCLSCSFPKALCDCGSAFPSCGSAFPSFPHGGYSSPALPELPPRPRHRGEPRVLLTEERCPWMGEFWCLKQSTCLSEAAQPGAAAFPTACSPGAHSSRFVLMDQEILPALAEHDEHRSASCAQCPFCSLRPPALPPPPPPPKPTLPTSHPQRAPPSTLLSEPWPWVAAKAPGPSRD